MKVKVGNKVYDSAREPVMVILTDEDKKNISNMDPGATKYMCCPDSTDSERVREFMKVEE